MTSAVPRIRMTYLPSARAFSQNSQTIRTSALMGAVRAVAGLYRFGRALRPLQLLADIPDEISIHSNGSNSGVPRCDTDLMHPILYHQVFDVQRRKSLLIVRYLVGYADHAGRCEHLTCFSFLHAIVGWTYALCNHYCIIIF